MSQTPSKREVRFGTIGCGAMTTKVHCPNINAIPGARTVAYCDLDESKAKALLDKHGGDYATTDCQRILNDDSIDAVTICLGPALHAKFVQAAAAAGKHIFVEKPLTLEIADAIASVRGIEEAGVKFVVGTCNRLAPLVQHAKKLCPKPKYSYAHSASTVVHATSHIVDMAMHHFHDAPLERVYAQGGVFFGGDQFRPVDSFTSILTFADGSTCTYMQHSIENTRLGKYSFELFDADRVVYVGNRFMECHLMRKDGHKQTWKYEGEPFYRGPFGYMGHYEELENLVACIRDGGTTAMHQRHAAAQVAVEVAMMDSIAKGQPVEWRKFLRAHDAEFILDAPAATDARLTVGGNARPARSAAIAAGSGTSR